MEEIIVESVTLDGDNISIKLNINEEPRAMTPQDVDEHAQRFGEIATRWAYIKAQKDLLLTPAE